MNNSQVAMDYSFNTVEGAFQKPICCFALVTGSDFSVIDSSEGRPDQQIFIKNNSRDFFKTFTKFLGESQNLPGYSYNGVISYVKNIFLDSEKIDNINKLVQLNALKDGWDGEQATALDESLIRNVLNIIIELNYQPEIFPTARDTIQIEYDKDDGSYLEIELSQNGNAKVFMIDSKGNEETTFMKAESMEINKVVNSFYE